MIRSFKCKETEKIYRRTFTSSFPLELHKSARRKLMMLDSVLKLKDLKETPGNRLEKLKGKRKNQYSIRMNKQFRICFKWVENNAYDVEIIDYH